MANFTDYTPTRVLAVGAHADDIDFSASGSIARWAAQGCDVHYLVVTDGSSGSADPAVSTKELIRLRETEQRQAAKLLGATDVRFLGYPDGMLVNSVELRRDIVRVIRQLQPDTVIVFDPTLVYSSEIGFINHPDHRAVGQATLDAVFPLARDHLSFPDLYDKEKLEPHKVEHVLLVNLEKANYYVDITDYFETKLKGLFAHTSQVSDTTAIRTMLTQRAKAMGKHIHTTYAEGFMRIDPPR